MTSDSPQKATVGLDPEDRTLGPWSYRTEAWIANTIGVVLGFVIGLHYVSIESAFAAAVIALLIGGILIESGVEI